MGEKDYSFRTRTVHVENNKHAHNSLRVPIYQSSTFVFDNVDHGASLFSGEKDGYIYSRLGNPTRDKLENKIADLAGGESALALASGMAAVSGLILGKLEAGDHLLAPLNLYGGSHDFFSKSLPNWNIEVSYVDMTDVDKIEKEIKENTKMIFVETPANPTLTVVNLEEIVKIADKYELLSAVDNTFMSPYLQRPLEYDIDFSVHSATKYIGGHGDTVAGFIIGNQEEIGKLRSGIIKDLGGVLAPFPAFLLLRGLKTLALRMDRISANTEKISSFLEGHRAVKVVNYPGLASHPQFELAQKQMKKCGGVLSFELKGGISAGRSLMDSVELCTLAVSLGDVDTLIQHPASMTHSGMEKQEREKAGITDGLIRLSVGIEEVGDIIEDLKQGLDKLI